MLKKYYSGYTTLGWNNKYGEPPYKGKYFTIDFDTPRDNRIMTFTRMQDSEGNDIRIKGKEAIILTKNIENAIKVSELINASFTLVEGANLLMDERPSTIPFSKEEQKDTPIEEICRGTYGSPETLLACKIASKASFRKAYCYALFKYRLGCSLFQVHPIDFDPAHSWYNKLSLFPSDCARLAYAIMLFYSVIEELELEIRASKENPSLINGEWNPKVKEDLETRLKKYGINITEPISWNLRSTPTKIERKLRQEKRLNPIKKSSWARGYVRDSEIELVNAILLISNLRSTISAHKFGKLVNSISIYDVSNANFLARRLLLETLGFW